MNYQTCLSEIEALIGRGMHRGLDRITQALNLLGNPQDQFKSIHVAGTNGKGSTCAILASILKEAGYKTGLTISPHILDYRERIQINGEWISKDDLIKLHVELKNKIGDLPLTYFEWTIVLAFTYFAQAKVDFAILETGMGGRWDATNVTYPLIGAITNIGLDHQAILGSTLPEILTEKMQILKPGMIAWTGIEDKNLVSLLQKYCMETGVTLNLLSDINFQPPPCALLGQHQKKNAALSVALCHSLIEKGYRISTEAIQAGLKNVFWPGRLEWMNLSPPILLDGAHNLDGMQTLIRFLKDSNNKFHIVFGTLRDRPFQEMASMLHPYALSFNIAYFDDERAFSMEELREKTREKIIPIHLKEWSLFIRKLPANEPVLVTGSLYLVSKVRTLIFH